MGRFPQIRKVLLLLSRIPKSSPWQIASMRAIASRIMINGTIVWIAASSKYTIPEKCANVENSACVLCNMPKNWMSY